MKPIVKKKDWQKKTDCEEEYSLTMSISLDDFSVYSTNDDRSEPRWLVVDFSTSTARLAGIAPTIN